MRDLSKPPRTQIRVPLAAPGNGVDVQSPNDQSALATSRGSVSCAVLNEYVA